MKFNKGVVLLSLTIFLLFSCSGSPPGIIKVDSSLIYKLDPAKGSQNYSMVFSVSVDDEDGINDIENVIVAGKDNGLYWDVKSDLWNIIQYKGMQWISFSIAPPYGTVLPAGEYRIIVRDYAGREDEMSYSIKQHPMTFKKSSFPSVVVTDVSIKSTSDRDIFILGYSADGRMLFSKSLSPGETLARSSFDVSITHIYAVLERDDYRLMVGPYYFF